MKPWDKIKRFFRNFAVEGLMIYVTVTVFIVFAASYIFPNTGILSYIYFSRDMILEGQVWRIVSFLFMPQTLNPLFMLINLYFYYIIGTSLEGYWGSVKFTRYFFAGAALLIAGGFIVGYVDAYYLYLSMFISYAILAPNEQFLFFGIIPIKAKYLAALDGVFMAVEFILGSASERVSIGASIILILLFFGKNIISRIKAKKRFNDFKKNFNK